MTKNSASRSRKPNLGTSACLFFGPLAAVMFTAACSSDDSSGDTAQAEATGTTSLSGTGPGATSGAGAGSTTSSGAGEGGSGPGGAGAGATGGGEPTGGAGVGGGGNQIPACTVTVSSLADVENAVEAAAAGDVVCLADGVYGKLELDVDKPEPGVMVRAENPGQAELKGAELGGSYITIARFKMTGTFEALPGSTGMTADHNLFIGGNYYGVMACASTTTTCNDVTITGNVFDGQFNEDVIRANRYHDGPDADSYGLLIEGNEFFGETEIGDHNDVFQSVWVGDHLYFRKNYMHGFGGQGFFVKDQASPIDTVVAEDNLIIDQTKPCDPANLCPDFRPSPFQVYGPATDVSIAHNTVWTPEFGSVFTLRGSGWGTTNVAHNVAYHAYSDTSAPFGADYTASDNLRCKMSGFSPVGFTTECAPAFMNAAAGDYRLASGQGVTWSLASQHFGP